MLNIAEAPTKEVTVREVFEALKKNGLSHVRSNWITTNKQGLVVGGCALGQTAYNLGVVPYGGNGDRWSGKDETYGLETQLNKYFTEKDIVTDDGKVVIYASTPVGSAIISINDSSEMKQIKTGKHKGGYRRTYKYSYEEVVKYAEIFLTPYFDKTIEVETFEYPSAS